MFIEKFVKIRLKYIQHSRTSRINLPPNNIYTRLPKISLPYFKNVFKKMSACLKKFNILPVPRLNYSLSNIIRLGKDRTDKWAKTGVVYKFSCKDCPASYVGETKRSLGTRIKEHVKKKNPNSVVSLHMDKNHIFDFENTKILDQEPSWHMRTFLEMAHITCTKNTINVKEDVLNLNRAYRPLLEKLCK